MDKLAKEKIITAIRCCVEPNGRCANCPYNRDKKGNIRSSNICRLELSNEAADYIDDLTNVIELLEAEK